MRQHDFVGMVFECVSEDRPNAARLEHDLGWLGTSCYQLGQAFGVITDARLAEHLAALINVREDVALVNVHPEVRYDRRLSAAAAPIACIAAVASFRGIT
jgi:hypothetical protein